MDQRNRAHVSGRRMSFERLETRAMLDGNSLALLGANSANHGAAEVVDDAVGVVQGGVPADLLPDLFAIAHESREYMHGWTLDTSEQPGRTLLRLTTAIGNRGDGAMELRGGQTLPSGSQEVFQRIFNNSGGWREVLAGTFTHHPEHDHLHFDGFAQYHLREVTAGNGVGAIVASGDKTSFCLLDIYKFDSAAGPDFYETCSEVVQGISVGWSDVYEQDLPDQWIDITDVPLGSYWLEVVADPDDQILETDEMNNAERILIELTDAPVLAADRFEVNNTFATATELGTLGDRSELGLSIHESDDDDYYRFTASETGDLDISIFFSNSQGDVDLEVYDSSEDLLEESTSTDDMEHVVISAIAGQTYVIHVLGFSGATNPDYDLIIGSGSPHPVDAFEPNDSFATAHDLGILSDFSGDELSIHASDNDDFYRFVAPANGLLDLDVFFVNASGDIDVVVFDASEAEIASSTSTDDEEHISIPVIAGETYVIHVYGFEGATNPHYDMEITASLLPGDYNNDGQADAADYTIWQDSFGQALAEYSGADGDGSGVVDAADRDVWRDHFGDALPAPATAAALFSIEKLSLDAESGKALADTAQIAAAELAPESTEAGVVDNNSIHFIAALAELVFVQQEAAAQQSISSDAALFRASAIRSAEIANLLLASFVSIDEDKAGDAGARSMVDGNDESGDELDQDGVQRLALRTAMPTSLESISKEL